MWFRESDSSAFLIFEEERILMYETTNFLGKTVDEKDKDQDIYS